MKKLIKSIALLAFLMVGFSSCSLEDPIESQITEYANFEYDELVTVPLGESYIPSAIATEGDTEIEVAVSGAEDVDVNTVGIYDVYYSAENSDGFAATVHQTVVVHDPTIVGTDVSGAIQDVGRPDRTGVISLVEGTTSIFYASDFGFGGTFPVYFQMDGDVISEIPQNYAFSATSVALTYDPVAKLFTTLIAPYGFGYTFEYQN